MSNNFLAGVMLAALFVAAPVRAQQSADAPAAPPGSAPISPASPPAGVVATTNNPNLAVATVKLETGRRASKLIGANVVNEGSEKVGTVDDLIMTADDKVTMAIISVGGVLGLGSKLVAVPWPQLRQDGDHVVLAGASKDSLNAMPSFEY